MESLALFVVLAWAAGLSVPALWLYLRTSSGAGEIRVVFVAATILCAIAVLTSWIMVDLLFGGINASALFTAGTPALISVIAVVAIARRSFQYDRQKEHRDA